MDHAADTASIAAKWWADILRRRSATYSNGSNDLGSMMAGMTAAFFAAGEEVTAEAVETFERNLTTHIRERLEKGDPYIRLAVDYDPEFPLADVIEASGVSPRLFPWKTSMNVTATDVEVKEGYGAAFVKLTAQGHGG